jgi:hypothetical protein
MDFEITWQGLEELTANFTTAAAKTADELIDAVNDITDEGITLAVARLQRNGSVETGKLAESIKQTSARKIGDTVKGDYRTDLEYAKWVEKGRGPVRPKTAKVLSWVPFFNKTRVFARYAGPAAARPFMSTSADDLKGYARDRFDKAAALIVARLMGRS